MSEPYEAVPYDDRPVAETHPDRLWLAARMAGLRTARPETMRVLELGCAHGVNLLPLAFHLPQARFLGIDLSPGQIERGRARVEALGVANLELRCADVMDFEPPHAFDVVIAHGLFSWVPDVVRDRILPLCRRALAPDGVAYVSYNAMPGSGMRVAMRRALQEIVGDENDPRRQVERARAGLERLGTVSPLRGTAEGALLAQEIGVLREKSDAYLLHEYLVPHGRAYWWREIVVMAEAAGLRCAADVAPTGLPDGEQSRVVEAMRELVGGDRIGAEQVADVITFRQFRATLLCRAEAECAASIDRDALLRELHVAAPPRDEPDEALAWLRERWPADVPFAALPEALARGVWAHQLAGRVQLRARPLPIVSVAGERPEVAPLTRFEVQHLDFVTTPLHEYAPLDAFHAALIRHLDGTRDHAALVEALIADISAGSLSVSSRAAPPSEEQLRRALPVMVHDALARLASAGLLIQ